MSNYRRCYEYGRSYFFTLVTHERNPILCTQHSLNRLRQAFAYAIKKAPFEIEGIVVLPDHLHCLWKLPNGDTNYSKRWHLIKRFFSIGMRGKTNLRNEKNIWQRRYWEHCIRDDKDWNQHLDYIYYNPVKHGYVSRPYDWEFSSFKRDVLKGLYDENWGSGVNIELKNVE